MGKVILNHIANTIATTAICYWYFVDTAWISEGKGLSVFITLIGILCIIYIVVAISRFIHDNWDD